MLPPMKRSNSEDNEKNSKKQKVQKNNIGNYEVINVTFCLKQGNDGNLELKHYFPGQIVEICRLKKPESLKWKDRIEGIIEEGEEVIIKTPHTTYLEKTEKTLEESKINWGGNKQGEILQHIYEENFEALQELLNNSCIDLNKKFEFKGVVYEFPLCHACAVGNLKIVKLLHTNGGNLNVKQGESCSEYSPIHEAICKNHKPVVEYLCTSGANLEAMSSQGCNPLHLASEGGKFEIVNILIENRANVNARTKNERGETALHLAASYGHLEVAVELVCGQNANVDIKDIINGQTPLLNAIDEGNEEIARFLINHNASINLRSFNQQCALQVAVSQNLIKTVQLLLKNNANPNTVSLFGYTPLLVSLFKFRIDIANVLLDYGADPNITWLGNHSALHFISLTGNLQWTKLLFAHGADVSLPIMDVEYQTLSMILQSKFYHLILYFAEHDSGSANWLKNRTPTSMERLQMALGVTTKAQTANAYILERISYLKEIQEAINQYFPLRNVPGLLNLINDYTHGLKNLSIFEIS